MGNVAAALLCCCDNEPPPECDCLLTSAVVTWTGYAIYCAECGYSEFQQFPPFWTNQATIEIVGGEFIHTWPPYPDPQSICGEPSGGFGNTTPVSPILGATCDIPPDGGTPLTPSNTARVRLEKPTFIPNDPNSPPYWRVQVRSSGPIGLGHVGGGGDGGWVIEFRKYSGFCPTGDYEFHSFDNTATGCDTAIAGSWGLHELLYGTLVVS